MMPYGLPLPEWLKKQVMPSPALIKKTAALDDEHADAYVIAAVVKSQRYPSRLLDILAVHDPRKLRLVHDVLQGKRMKSELKAVGVKIVQAWYAANWRGGRIRNDGTHITLDFSVPAPTVTEIKTEFAIAEGEQPPRGRAKIPRWLEDLEAEKKIPSDPSFRYTLARCQLEVTEKEPGRPRGKSPSGKNYH